MNIFKNLFCDKVNNIQCDVDLKHRIGAYIVDWVLGGIFTGLPGVFVCLYLTKENTIFTDLYIFEALGYQKYLGLLVGGMCFIFALFYYVYIMWKIFPGQTIGKKIFGFKVVMLDNSKLSIKAILIRQVIGLFIIEGIAFTISSYIRQMITLVTRYYVDNFIRFICMLFFIISGILVSHTVSKRALHDYISNTKVVR